MSIKININKRYNHVPYFSHSGDGLKRTYKYKHLDDGSKVLVYAKSQNLYELIQSYKDETNIYNIAEKFFSGDLQLLDYNKSLFMDTTIIPKNYVDFKNHYLETENLFRSLPVDFKSLFNNDYGKFAKSLEDGSFKNVLLDNNDMLQHKMKFNAKEFFGIKDDNKEVLKDEQNITENKE